MHSRVNTTQTFTFRILLYGSGAIFNFLTGFARTSSAQHGLGPEQIEVFGKMVLKGSYIEGEIRFIGVLCVAPLLQRRSYRLKAKDADGPFCFIPLCWSFYCG